MTDVKKVNDKFIEYFFEPYDMSKSRSSRYAHEAKKFDPKDVVKWMDTCVERGGYPMFRVRYRGDYGVFYNRKPATYAICWGKDDHVPTQFYYDVPPSLWLAMAEGRGDWDKILKYFSEKREISPVEAKKLESLISRRGFFHFRFR